MKNKYLLSFFLISLFLLCSCNASKKEATEFNEIQKEEINDNKHLDTKVDETIEPVNGMCTIVSEAGYIIGGSNNGKWMGTDEISKLICGGEKYKLYSSRMYLGDFVGEKPKVENGPGQWISLPIKYDDKVSDNSLNEKTNNRYENFFSKKIAISSNWNALPRIPKMQNNNNDNYKKIFEDILKSKGIYDTKVNIRQIIRIDLEGDGTEEVLITASNIDFPLDVVKKNNTYSIVMLRKIVNGSVENRILKEEYYNEDGSFESGCPFVYYIPGVLDANGDGIMEIFIEEKYYEGESMEVYEIKKNNIKRVLSYGVGA